MAYTTIAAPQQQYTHTAEFPPEIEVDEEPNKQGEYRVWHNITVIGIFTQNPDGSWLSQSKYEDWRCQPHQTDKEAINAIIHAAQSILAQNELEQHLEEQVNRIASEFTYTETCDSDNIFLIYSVCDGDKYLGRVTRTGGSWTHSKQYVNDRRTFATREAAAQDLADVKRTEDEVFQRCNQAILRF